MGHERLDRLLWDALRTAEPRPETSSLMKRGSLRRRELRITVLTVFVPPARAQRPYSCGLTYVYAAYPRPFAALLLRLAVYPIRYGEAVSSSLSDLGEFLPVLAQVVS